MNDRIKPSLALIGWVVCAGYPTDAGAHHEEVAPKPELTALTGPDAVNAGATATYTVRLDRAYRIAPHLIHSDEEIEEHVASQCGAGEHKHVHQDGHGLYTRCHRTNHPSHVHSTASIGTSGCDANEHRHSGSSDPVNSNTCHPDGTRHNLANRTAELALAAEAYHGTAGGPVRAAGRSGVPGGKHVGDVQGRHRRATTATPREFCTVRLPGEPTGNWASRSDSDGWQRGLPQRKSCSVCDSCDYFEGNGRVSTSSCDLTKSNQDNEFGEQCWKERDSRLRNGHQTRRRRWITDDPTITDPGDYYGLYDEDGDGYDDRDTDRNRRVDNDEDGFRSTGTTTASTTPTPARRIGTPTAAGTAATPTTTTTAYST